MSDERPPAHVGSRWSWRVGTILGIPIRVHATLAILLAWIAASHAIAGRGLLDVLQGLALVVAIFGLVLLHEVGHALMARHFGIATRDITLLPIGGISRIERWPSKPAQELAVAVAGPAVNVVLAALTVLVLAALRSPVLPRALLTVGSPFLAQLLWINLSLALFNLLPAFPTDGGRALRALLAMRLAPARATVIAAHVGQVMALLFAAVGVVYNPLLVLIAIFLFLGAEQEARWARLKAALAGVPVDRAMVTEFRTLDAREPLARAAELVVAGAPPCFAVERDDRFAGLLTREDLVGGLARRGPEVPVGEVMHSRVEIVRSGTPLDEAIERARTGTPVAVERDGEIIGLLTSESVLDLVQLTRTLQHGGLAWRR